MIIDSPRIIIVDDEKDQVEKLFEILWEKEIPFVYLNGQVEKLPKKPITGVRLLFLDIELGIKGNSPKTMASSLVSKVIKIIGSEPIPYIIIFWTGHSEVIPIVIEYLAKINMAPIEYLDFDKPKYWTTEGEYSQLVEHVDGKLRNLGSFNYILEFENVLEEAMNEFSKDIFTIVNSNGNKETYKEKTTKMLWNLGSVYSGNNRGKNISIKDVKNSYLMLKESFSDNIEKRIDEGSFDYSYVERKEQIDIELASKINAKMFFNLKPATEPAIGNVYIKEDVKFEKALISNIFKKKAIPNKMTLCGMIITPSCDLAQNKQLYYEEENKKSYRVIYGLLILVGEEIKVYRDLKVKTNGSIFIMRRMKN